MLTNDADNGHYNWVSHARDLRAPHEVQQWNARSVIKTKINKYFESEVFHRLSKHTTDNRKLHLYASYKTIFKFDSYLDYIQDFTARCALASLQVSVHNLQTRTAKPWILLQLKMKSTFSLLAHFSARNVKVV